MSDHLLVRVHLSSGQVVAAIWEAEPDQDSDEVEDVILELLKAHPREFLLLGDTIVHTGAISAVEVVS